MNKEGTLSPQEQRTTGAGLGLAIAKRILELHGSAIEAQSILQSGTAFTFHLPTAQPPTEPIGSSATGYSPQG